MTVYGKIENGQLITAEFAMYVAFILISYHLLLAPDIAQLVERLPCTQEVRSSTLLGSTTIYAYE